jgi:hypothetical protein
MTFLLLCENLPHVITGVTFRYSFDPGHTFPSVFFDAESTRRRRHSAHALCDLCWKIRPSGEALCDQQRRQLNV